MIQEDEIVEKKILKLRSELKSDRLDMSFGEIINIYDKDDLIIRPEYQRAYRWNDEQRTEFIESILLGIPIPPIFVAEDNDGKWELVDGLQRIATILSFFGVLKNDFASKNNFKLSSTDLTDNCLEGLDLNSLSPKLILTIKRAVCRVEILRWDSGFDMRYELFNRLNTSSSPLKEQEIRNCALYGVFNDFLKKLAKIKGFSEVIEPDQNKRDKFEEEMYLEELLLRYFSIIYGDLNIKKSISNYLTQFMKNVNAGDITINYDKEKDIVISIVDFLKKLEKNNLFYGRNGRFSENLFESFMYLLHNNLENITKNQEKFLQLCDNIKGDENYKHYSGYTTHMTYRLERKINRVKEMYDELF